jgi:hypothetical protein
MARVRHAATTRSTALCAGTSYRLCGTAKFRKQLSRHALLQWACGRYLPAHVRPDDFLQLCSSGGLLYNSRLLCARVLFDVAPVRSPHRNLEN